MAEPVKIPISTFEFVLDYERPQIKLLLDRISVVQAVFDALKPWDPRIDDLDVVTTGKASEQGVTIKLPRKRASFFFGAASCKFASEGVDWQSVDETIAVLDAAVGALVRSAGVAGGRTTAVVYLHLQPNSRSFKDLLAPFVVPQLAGLEPGPMTTMAAVTKWENRRVTIDGSGILANALFLCLERNFPDSTSYQDIAGQMRKDQEEMFRILGVEEDRE